MISQKEDYIVKEIRFRNTAEAGSEIFHIRIDSARISRYVTNLAD